MLRDFRPLLLTLALIPLLDKPAATAEPSPDAIDFFEKEVRPLLVSRCYECHGDLKEPKGGLKLTSRAGLLAGGETGPAAVPGKPGESLLIEAVRYQGLKMPPKAKLPEEEIEKFARWVELGLPWPQSGDQPAVAASPEQPFQISAVQRGFWSFQTVGPQTPPGVKDTAWPLTAVDRFILAKLESRGLRPNRPAEKRTLLRRATFDLIGLPPTPQEIDAFLADETPEAFSRVVDRLLASSHYGEHWGRHWLDVVRYADTAGETADFPVPQAYKYRNYVIDAFNRDKPYDEFIREQIAGDILAKSGPRETYAERTTATGYLAISRRFGFDSENYHHLTIADTLDTLGRSILGLSIGCARCHDHKYDPISMADYYALYGIFASSRYAFPGSEEKKQPRDFVPLLPDAEAAPLAAAHQEQLARCEAELKRLDGESKALSQSIKTAEESIAKQAQNSAVSEATVKEAQGVVALKAKREQLGIVIGQWREKRDALVIAGPFEMAYGMIDDSPQNAKIQKRGEPTKLGSEVPRRFLEILGGDPLSPDAPGSGRLQLADWLTRRSNPLTARVIVNRIWQYHFGRGLVQTPSDFGLRGRAPANPELLDYLADTLMSQGWSIKGLHKEIMLSRVYQMASDDAGPAAQQDASNEFWWKFERRRLEAESIRDAVLAVSGQLDASPSGPHPFPPRTSWGFTQHAPFKATYESNRRSVYLMTQRIQKHPFLGLFDGADPNTSTAERSLTTTPSQALFLMNDPFIHQQSSAFARRLVSAHNEDSPRLQLAYSLAFARPAEPPEVAEAAEFLERYRQQLAASGIPADEAAVAAWSAYVRVLLTSNEFLYIE
ncbi:MAG: PSD1 domain-containing protein [Planctomycetia bacterium]|nr:PSD1 domain-containing protein [Planctomycetia bacterium]